MRFSSSYYCVCYNWFYLKISINDKDDSRRGCSSYQRQTADFCDILIMTGFVVADFFFVNWSELISSMIGRSERIEDR